MFPLIGLVAGAAFGWVRAARRGGVTADKLQYAFGHAVAFCLAGFALGLAISWIGRLFGV